MTKTIKKPSKHALTMRCADGKKLTKQEFARDVNINTIMEKARRTGLPPAPPALFGDFTATSDYTTAYNQVLEAQEAFMRLPSAFRKEMLNDPARAVAFCADPKNLDRLRELGMAPRLNTPSSPGAPPSSASSPAKASESPAASTKEKENASGKN